MTCHKGAVPEDVKLNSTGPAKYFDGGTVGAIRVVVGFQPIGSHHAGFVGVHSTLPEVHASFGRDAKPLVWKPLWVVNLVRGIQCLTRNGGIQSPYYTSLNIGTGNNK